MRREALRVISKMWPHSKCNPGMEIWEVDKHEVAFSWLRASKMWPGNGILGSRRTRLGAGGRPSNFLTAGGLVELPDNI
eukprot:4860775-Pyramimonas_sp.AAC.1